MTTEVQPPVPTAPTPGAPPAAPAAPPVAPQPLTLNEPEKPEPPGPDDTIEVIYEPTGDAGLDVALAFVGQRGFGPDHPAVVAAQKGDFTPMEDALKKLGDKAKGYAPYLTAAKDSYQRAQASAQETLNAVVEAAGGAAKWNAIRTWAAANADEGEKKQINAAFGGGKLSAVAMVRQLEAAYRSSGAAGTAPPSGLKEGASSAGGSSDALSPAQYKAELAKLYTKYGNRASMRPEFTELTNRRKAYQGA